MLLKFLHDYLAIDDKYAKSYYILSLNWKSYMNFPLAYLHLTLTDSKGKGHVTVMYISTELDNIHRIFATFS